jgi:hypothetical protein
MPPELPYLMLFVFLAGTVQGTVGFGFGLVAMSTLPLWIDIKEAVPLVALLCWVVNASLTYKMRHYLTWSRIGNLLLGSLAGVPIGVFLFSYLNPQWLLVGLGVALLGVTIQQMAWKPKETDRPVSRFWGGLAGFASGILGGAFNTGGPPAVMYVGIQRWSKEHTVATLQGFFLSITTLQIVLFLWKGLIQSTHSVDAAMLLIPTILGVALGQFFFHRVNQARFRALLLLGIGVLGISLVYKGLSPLFAS